MAVDLEGNLVASILGRGPRRVAQADGAIRGDGAASRYRSMYASSIAASGNEESRDDADAQGGPGASAVTASAMPALEGSAPSVKHVASEQSCTDASQHPNAAMERHTTSILLDRKSYEWVSRERIRRCSDPSMRGRRTKNAIFMDAIERALPILDEWPNGGDLPVDPSAGDPIHMSLNLDHEKWVGLVSRIESARLAGAPARSLSVSALVRAGISLMAMVEGR